MNFKICLGTIALFGAIFSWACGPAHGQETVDQTIFDVEVNPGALLREFPAPSGELEGSTYLYENWYPGTAILNNGTAIRNYPLKIDVFNERMEVRASDKVRVCGFDRIDRIALVRSGRDTIFFINAARYQSEEDQTVEGLFRLVYDGKIKVVSHPYTEVLKATYVPTVDVGSRNDQILMQQDLFFVDTSGVYVAIDRRARNNRGLFGRHAGAVEKYIKREKLKFRQEGDIIRIFRYYDGLI